MCFCSTRRHFLLALPLLLLCFGGLTSVKAEQTPLLVDFTSAIQALNKTFDPRDDQQWSNMSRFLSNPDLQWIVRYSFSKERTRGIYNYLYSQCSPQGSNKADMLQIIEAGRFHDAGGIHVLVTPAIFSELQRTLKPPKDTTILFRAARDNAPSSIVIKYSET